MLIAEVLRSALFGVFRYSGRSDRLEYWTFCLLTVFFALMFAITIQYGVPFEGAYLMVTSLLILWFTLSHVALMVRRLHDHGLSGFWLILPFTGLCIAAAGYLGGEGHSSYMRYVMETYGLWITRGGLGLASVTSTILVSYLIGPGSEKENKYGDPI
jgi:uncharacterized membrane protein YhaH (DUF805 family)